LNVLLCVKSKEKEKEKKEKKHIPDIHLLTKN